jgi:hypothetical protein
MTPKDLLDRIKVLKHLEDTESYDGELSLIINSSISKLDGEGVPLPDETKSWQDQYLMCVFHYVTLVWDDEVNKNISEMLYIDSVENLRMKVLYEARSV